MKKYMPLEGLRWSRDSGSTLCDTPQNGRSRTGWGGQIYYVISLVNIYPTISMVKVFARFMDLPLEGAFLFLLCP